MDSITHVVAGAAIGELLVGKTLGKKAMLWGALAASLPDIDSVLYLFTDDVESLVLHRGITHALLTAVLISPLLAWIFKRFYPQVTFIAWSLFFLIQLVLHDLLDTTTVYGTGLLLPFNSYRFSWDNIFVLDPLFTLPLLISFIVLVTHKTGYRWRRRWALSGLIISSLYMAITFFNKSKVESVFKHTLKENGIEYTQYFTAPVLLNNVLWHAVATNENGHYTAHYSLMDTGSTMQLNYIPKNDSLMGEMIHSENVKTLIKFSKGFYCVTKDKDGIWFNDMRFGQVMGWDAKDANFAFSFNLKPGADNSTVVQKGRMEGLKKDGLASLWNRIKGKKP
jgi:inner membrane protein